MAGKACHVLRSTTRLGLTWGLGLMTQLSGFAIAASIAFFALAAGMVYVTWINPQSRFHRVFCARWSVFGRVASKFGAVAQSLTLVSFGSLVWLSTLGSPSTRLAYIPLAVGVVLAGIARLSDLRDDEA